MALLGADDLPLTRHLRPALSSLAMPVDVIAECVFRILTELLDGPADGTSGPVPARDGLLVPQVVRRGTT